ncbi:RIP metalloprotease [Chloroflexota bacterium]
MIANVAITVIAFLGVLAGLVLAHEFGHFATAKAFKVRVEEFGVGFPPKLFSVQKGETKYSLNAIPLGGFTKMAGEEDPQISRSLASKRTGVRIFVLSAGSLMNFLVPVILFTMSFIVPHNVLVGDVVVEEVAVSSPADNAGIKSGDVILSVNDTPIRNINALQIQVYLNLGQQIDILVRHNDSTSELVQLIPGWQSVPGEGRTGIVLARMPDPIVVRESYPFWEAVPMGIGQCAETFTLFKNEIMSWFVQGASPQVTGPVGIAQMVGDVARAGLSPLLQLAAFLSINLAIINILPLPALDGGRITFVILEKIRRGKRISARTEGLVHFIGFALLIAVIMVITYQDIIRIASG